MSCLGAPRARGSNQQPCCCQTRSYLLSYCHPYNSLQEESAPETKPGMAALPCLCVPYLAQFALLYQIVVWVVMEDACFLLSSGHVVMTMSKGRHVRDNGKVCVQIGSLLQHLWNDLNKSLTMILPEYYRMIQAYFYTWMYKSFLLYT